MATSILLAVTTVAILNGLTLAAEAMFNFRLTPSPSPIARALLWFDRVAADNRSDEYPEIN